MTTMKIPFLVWIYEGGILISILCEFLLALALNSPLSSSFQDYVIKIIKFIVCIFLLELCNKESVTFRQMMKTWFSDINSIPSTIQIVWISALDLLTFLEIDSHENTRIPHTTNLSWASKLPNTTKYLHLSAMYANLSSPDLLLGKVFQKHFDILLCNKTTTTTFACDIFSCVRFSVWKSQKLFLLYFPTLVKYVASTSSWKQVVWHEHTLTSRSSFSFIFCLFEVSVVFKWNVCGFFGFHQSWAFIKTENILVISFIWAKFTW